MVCGNTGIYGFLGTSWVLITVPPRNSIREALPTINTIYLVLYYVLNTYRCTHYGGVFYCGVCDLPKLFLG